jgi:hypothetical protein
MKIAICIPVFQPPPWYELVCLSSVLLAMDRATAEGHEVSLLVGADGCEDARHRTLEFGLPVYYSSENVGCYVMRNSLYAAAGPVDAYAYFDADNWMHPQHLILHADALPAGGITTPHSINVRKGKETKWSIFPGGGGLISKEAWEALGGYRAERCHADKDAALRWELLGTPHKVVDMATWRRYVWERSLTVDAATDMRSDYRKQVKEAATRDRDAGILTIAATICPLTRFLPW